MKEFIEYFFGKGDEVEFSNFTLAHFLPILVTVALIYLVLVLGLTWLLGKVEKYMAKEKK